MMTASVGPGPVVAAPTALRTRAVRRNDLNATIVPPADQAAPQRADLGPPAAPPVVMAVRQSIAGRAKRHEVVEALPMIARVIPRVAAVLRERPVNSRPKR